MSADLKDMITVGGVIAAAISLMFTALTTWRTAKANRARFWLDLRDHFAQHDCVHRRLRPMGDWSKDDGPKTNEEWASVEAYMGLFEHCEIMLEQRLIDEKTFREIYAYRLRNIVANDIIRQNKLIGHPYGWKRFLALLQRLKVKIPK